MELREILENAVRRELLEETRVEVEAVKPIGIYESVHPQRHCIIVGYTVRIVGGRVAEEGDDAEEAAWVPLEDITTLDLSPKVSYFLELGLQRD